MNRISLFPVCNKLIGMIRKTAQENLQLRETLLIPFRSYTPYGKFHDELITPLLHEFPGHPGQREGEFRKVFFQTRCGIPIKTIPGFVFSSENTAIFSTVSITSSMTFCASFLSLSSSSIANAALPRVLYLIFGIKPDKQRIILHFAVSIEFFRSAPLKDRSCTYHL